MAFEDEVEELGGGGFHGSWFGGLDSAAGLEIGELGVALEPGVPTGHQRRTLPLADEDAVQVAAGDSQFRSGGGRSGEADQRAFGLVWDGGHGFLVALV